MNRKYHSKISRILGMVFAVCALLLIATPGSFAAGISFSATGEYVASDFEPPAVVEQRAFMAAKQAVAEQASAYVTKHIRDANGKITKERSDAIAWNLLQETRRDMFKEALPGSGKHA